MNNFCVKMLSLRGHMPVILFAILFTLKGLVSASESQPTIWISGCTKPQNESTAYLSFSKSSAYRASYWNKCVRKISDSYICKGDTEKVVFTCEASYPILWKFPYSETIRTESSTISSLSNLVHLVQQNSTDSIYRTILVIPCEYSHSPTATLTCVSTDLEVKQSFSVFIANTGKHWLATDPPNVTVASITNHVIVNPLILPCSHFAPNQVFSLEKQVNITSSDKVLETEWQLANFTRKQLKFDPSIGYIFNTSTIPVSKLLGLYRCPIDEQFTKHLYESPSHQLFNVTKAQESRSLFKSTSIITGNASISLEIPPIQNLVVDASMQIKCCSGIPGQPPVLAATAVDTQNQLKHWKQLIDNQAIPWETYHHNDSINCQTIHLHYPAYLVTCRGENVNFGEIYVSVFHSMSNLPVRERWKQVIEADNLNTSSTRPAILTRYVPESSVDKLDVHQKIMMVIAHQTEQVFSSNEKLDFYFGFSDMFLENQTIPTNRSFYEYPDYRYLTTLSEYNRDVYFEGETINVLCFGLKFLYASGGKLAVNWKNGSVSEMELESFVERQGIQGVYLQKAIFAHFALMDRTISLFSKTINASLEIDSVECWMPVIGSRKWEKLRKGVTVEKPSFLEQKEETVYLSPGEEMQIVTCSVADWKPSSNISVTWNDNPLDIEWRDDDKENLNAEMVQSHVRVAGARNDSEGNMILIQIVFYNVSSNHSGIYKCNADNGIMNATRIVFVSEKPGHFRIIVLSITAVLLVVILLAYLQYKTGCYGRLKRKLTNGYVLTANRGVH